MNFTVKIANEEDALKIEKLSDDILENLSKNKVEDYFGGVDKDEVLEAMKFPSITFCAVSDKGELVGFALLQTPSESDIQSYISTFNDDRILNSLILNGYGVKPEWQRKGVALAMLNVAKNYALSQGYGVLIGTVHPQNKASIKAMAHISKEFNKGEVYHHTTKSGRTLEREKFNIKL